MSQENVEVVREQFRATNERDFPRAMDCDGKIVRVELYGDRARALEAAGLSE